jgi:hypothetical protein
MAHIPLSFLWEYSRNPNPAQLPSAEWEHLLSCESCIAVLWTCRASDSLAQVEEKLKEQRADRD